MRILFTSTSFPSDDADWKGLFILRMLEGLSRRENLELEAWCPPGPMPGNVSSALKQSDAEWLQRLASRGGIAHLLRKRPLQGLTSGAGLVIRLQQALSTSGAELFHINWLQNALAMPDDGRPALVTALGTDMQLLRLPMVRYLLRRKFTRRQVILCPNAEWMVPRLERDFGDVARIKCVPFGIDQPWYQVERLRADGIPYRWICVTRLTAGKLGPLFEWSAPCFADGRRELHLIGPRQQSDIAIPDWVHFHGPATPGQLRENWFPHATGLISLSTHPEGRPQVMLEAMAAGLPILASGQPAHKDIVAHQRTGWICEDASDLENGLAYMEAAESNRGMGQRARTMAHERFGDWDDCAARYAALYAELHGEPR